MFVFVDIENGQSSVMFGKRFVQDCKGYDLQKGNIFALLEKNENENSPDPVTSILEALKKIKNLFCLPLIVGLKGSKKDIEFLQDKNEDQ